MISSNTRATRSRFSSPARQPQQNGLNGNGDGAGPLEPSRSSANEGSRTFMEKWLEPSVQNKTSYEEAGLMKYGVLENMAPLGTMPKPQKTGAGQENGNGSTVRRIILRQSLKGAANPARGSSPGPGTPSAAVDAGDAHDSAAAAPTPEPPPATQSAPATQTSSSRPPARRSLAARDADEDDDYDPRKPARRKPMGRPSLPKRGRPPSSARRSSMASAKSSPVKQRPATPPPPETHGPDFVEKVIEAAVDEALHHFRYPTAYALRTLYDEKAGDAAFVNMIEDVFSQSADAETLEEFSRQLEEKKREGKQDNQGRDYFVPPPDDGRVTPHRPKPAPYASLIHRSAHGSKDEGETRAAKKLKISHRSSENTPRKMASSTSAAKGAGSVKTPSSRRRARRDSGGSVSSLSSVENLSSPELPEGSDLVTNASLGSPSFRGVAKAKARARARAKAGATGPQSPSQSGARPITTRRKSLASTKQQQQQAVSNASGSNSPTTLGSPTQDFPHHLSNSRSAGDDASMPGRLASSAPEQFSIRDRLAASTAKGDSKPHMTEERDEAWEKRREAQRVTNGYTAVESSIRDGDGDRQTTPVRKTRKTRQSVLPSASTRATRSANKRFNDDNERFASPGVFSVQGDGSSVFGSRAATPTTSLRPAKKQKTGLRVKSSPVKKKGGTAAGVPRSAGEAQSSANSGGAAKDQATDNDESCSACGNAGDVVCCDGCPRSFHFECVDMNPEEDLPDEWYCNECLVKRYPSRVPVHKGVFGSPLNLLEKTIPRAFTLPKRVQNRFEGVKAGADGDYEEVSTTKVTTRRKTNGYEESPDFFKQREDGEAVLCHHCLKPATDVRAIISCSVCPLHWHIDCLDPPLAVPPVLKTWKCPAHADDLLQEAPPLAPAHRYRRVKNAAAVAPAISRGLRNNGHIDIDWSSEPEDDDRSGWRDIASFGRIYKVPVRGVRLDFIEQLRKQGAGYAPPRDEPRRVEPYLTPPVEDVARPTPATASSREVEEVQTSLILTSLKSAPTDGLEQLTSALLSSAEPNVISLIAQGDADNIARDHLVDHDKVSLRALLTQMESMSGRIREVLGEGAQPSLPGTVGGPRPPSTIADSKGSVDKMDSEPLVTEPTPPSTIDHEGVMDFD